MSLSTKISKTWHIIGIKATERLDILTQLSYPKQAAVKPTHPSPAPSSVTARPLSQSCMLLHLASKYFASTNAASHTTQLTSPTSFWHNVNDLPQLLISNFLVKKPSSIYICFHTSHSLTSITQNPFTSTRHKVDYSTEYTKFLHVYRATVSVCNTSSPAHSIIIVFGLMEKIGLNCWVVLGMCRCRLFIRFS